ncbi:DUF4124 domain-containing protein [Methylomarinum sp. Ch1-1]|uniref:DUF4124 domain-containing protein n=1 Tax=Methylomarinum roseum TaxID=3067653 RepID=A0AAU7NW69_9GAMM|nr:DUF4124 domain-containing protein [Methylomarinum sp. Ch1-1]MDP4522677.1 DUF4124 domain-containing protein [Methylomarinum sp. Ch1-1]
MKKTILMIAALFSGGSFAGVYKCTDASGNTSYQSKPCADRNKSFEMDIKSGAAVDLGRQQRQKQQEAEEQQRLQQQERQRLLQIERRNKAAVAESEINQAMIKSNPAQYSPFAIPAYKPEKLPALVKQFAERLPDIEKFRRLAAQKALASGQCQRVEADELDLKSRKSKLVFVIDCSSGKRLYFNEMELTEQ